MLASRSAYSVLCGGEGQRVDIPAVAGGVPASVHLHPEQSPQTGGELRAHREGENTEIPLANRKKDFSPKQCANSWLIECLMNDILVFPSRRCTPGSVKLRGDPSQFRSRCQQIAGSQLLSAKTFQHRAISSANKIMTCLLTYLHAQVALR